MPSALRRCATGHGLLSEFEEFAYGRHHPTTVLRYRGQYLGPRRVHRSPRRALGEDRRTGGVGATGVVGRSVRRAENALHPSERDGLAAVHRNARLPTESVIDRQGTEPLKQAALEGDQLSFNSQTPGTPSLRCRVMSPYVRTNGSATLAEDLGVPELVEVLIGHLRDHLHLRWPLPALGHVRLGLLL